jgi:hypothetical protein
MIEERILNRETLELRKSSSDVGMRTYDGLLRPSSFTDAGDGLGRPSYQTHVSRLLKSLHIGRRSTEAGTTGTGTSKTPTLA